MKNVLVFIDLTKMDASLIRYSARLREEAGIDKISFLHYVQLQDMTEDYKSHFPSLSRPLEDVIKEEISEQVEENGFNAAEYDIEVHSKGGLESLINFINQSDYDLCIVGKKVIHRGSGVFAAKLIRLLDKNMLLMTETARPVLDNVLIPYDFSSYSQKALQFVRDKVSNTRTKLHLVHVAHIPPAYFPFVKEDSVEIKKTVRERSLKKLKEAAEKYLEDQNWEATVVEAENSNVSKTIYDHSRKTHSDLIVMGIKGKSDDEGLLLGSTAERLIQSDREIPVLLIT